VNEIRFGDAVESDTIAEMLQRAVGWTVTLGLNGGETEGAVADVNSNGLYLKEEVDRMGNPSPGSYTVNLYYWTNIDFITIH
jgi:hypothetical protein